MNKLNWIELKHLENVIEYNYRYLHDHESTWFQLQVYILSVKSNQLYFDTQLYTSLKKELITQVIILRSIL